MQFEVVGREIDMMRRAAMYGFHEQVHVCLCVYVLRQE